uniref:Uncharacterized protein n=1 Tax=Eutreptiella gymnastica TaxID=73025 RepID=A0A7S4LA33_9EUGL
MFRPHGSSFDPITGDIPERRPSPFRIVRGPPVRSQSPRFGSPNDAAGMESPPRRADTPAAAGPGMRGPSPGRSTGGSRSSSIADVYTSSVMCPLVAATAGAGDGLGARAGGSRPAKARAGLCRAPSPVHGNPGGRGAEEVWLVLLWDRERLWYDRTAHLCPDCSHTARRAYDAPFQVQCRLRREQEAQGALREATNKLRSASAGGVPLGDVLGQHWDQLKVQWDIINALLHDARERTSSSQRIESILQDFKRQSLERLPKSPADLPRAPSGQLERLKKENKRLMEDVEMLHSANTLLESDVQLVSDKLERLVKKAARNESKGGQDAAAAALRQELALSHTAQQDLEDALKSAQTQERRLHKENVALQERLLQAEAKIALAPAERLQLQFQPDSPQAHLVEELQQENERLWRSNKSLELEVEQLKAQCQRGETAMQTFLGLDAEVVDLRSRGLNAEKEMEQLREQLSKERERRVLTEQRLQEDSEELITARQELCKAQVGVMQMMESVTVKDKEILSIKHLKTETSKVQIGDGGRTDSVHALQKELEQAQSDLMEERSKSWELQAHVNTLQHDLKALRRTFETQGKQLDSTLKTLSEKEALLTEAQLAVQQHKRSLRDQQWELKTLREEVQLRRNNRSGRSTPVHAASPTPMSFPNVVLSSPVRPPRTASPCRSFGTVASGTHGPPKSESSKDGDDPTAPSTQCKAEESLAAAEGAAAESPGSAPPVVSTPGPPAPSGGETLTPQESAREGARPNDPDSPSTGRGKGAAEHQSETLHEEAVGIATAASEQGESV